MTVKQPLRLKEMAPDDVVLAIAANPRLIVPASMCEQHGPHLPLGSDTIIVERARVRVIDIFAIDLTGVVETSDSPIHGGEVDTALMLYIASRLVRMDLARDCILSESERRRYRQGTVMRLPASSQGSVGEPTRASLEKGRIIYEFIRNRIRERVLGVDRKGAEAEQP